MSPWEIARYCEVRVPKLKRIGPEWRGACPIHKGKHASFAINPETGEWYCHSRCGRGGSLIGLEVELSGLSFPAAAAQVRGLVGTPEQSSIPGIVATYDYTDEQGNRLFQSVRSGPKKRFW
ncbi:MAG: CHC2 zinc finger domain-containing protein [Acidobacteriota bacterium]